MDREKAQGVKGLQGINEDLSPDSLTSLKLDEAAEHMSVISTLQEREMGNNDKRPPRRLQG